MTAFANTETMYQVLGKAFKTWASHPDVASRLQEADISLRFNLNNPYGCLYLSRNGKVIFGTPDIKAKVEMTLDGDTIHQCLLRTALISSALFWYSGIISTFIVMSSISPFLVTTT